MNAVLLETNKEDLTKLIKDWLRERKILGEEESIQITLKPVYTPKVSVELDWTGELLAMPTEIFCERAAISTRARNTLTFNLGIRTLGQIVRSNATFSRFRGFGKGPMERLRAVIEGLGLELQNPLAPVGEEERRFLSSFALKSFFPWPDSEYAKYLTQAGIVKITDALDMKKAKWEKKLSLKLLAPESQLDTVERRLTTLKDAFLMRGLPLDL